MFLMKCHNSKLCFGCVSSSDGSVLSHDRFKDLWKEENLTIMTSFFYYSNPAVGLWGILNRVPSQCSAAVLLLCVFKVFTQPIRSEMSHYSTGLPSRLTFLLLAHFNLFWIARSRSQFVLQQRWNLTCGEPGLGTGAKPRQAGVSRSSGVITSF